jgi:hypothetical protein
MTMNDRRPAALARWLLDRALGDDDRGRTIRGDLLEEFRRDDDPGRAVRRYWRHALSMAVRYRSAKASRSGHASRSAEAQEHASMIESIWHAQQRSVLGLILQQGFSMALVGSIIGVAGAVALSRWIEGLLFHVTATDPATLAIVVGVLIAVGAAACLVPAWSTSRIDPIQAIRTE